VSYPWNVPTVVMSEEYIGPSLDGSVSGGGGGCGGAMAAVAAVSAKFPVT